MVRFGPQTGRYYSRITRHKDSAAWCVQVGHPGPRASEALSPSAKPYSHTLSEPFLGTPIAMTARRKSRYTEAYATVAPWTTRVL